ncbi:MAG: hypothetical protein NZO58_01865 [Gemmataceae bacterium]|nr:hypothetical protein [Gemmataceae bacterium]
MYRRAVSWILLAIMPLPSWAATVCCRDGDQGRAPHVHIHWSAIPGEPSRRVDEGPTPCPCQRHEDGIAAEPVSSADEWDPPGALPQSSEREDVIFLPQALFDGWLLESAPRELGQLPVWTIALWPQEMRRQTQTAVEQCSFHDPPRRSRCCPAYLQFAVLLL